MSFDCPVCSNTVSVARRDAVGAVQGGARIRIGCPECRNVHGIAKPLITTASEAQARRLMESVGAQYDGEIV